MSLSDLFTQNSCCLFSKCIRSIEGNETELGGGSVCEILITERKNTGDRFRSGRSCMDGRQNSR
jgi:hypothetical protein